MRFILTIALFAVPGALAQNGAQAGQRTAPQQGTTADANTKPAEKCSVEGKAVNAVTGEPLKKTHVLLQGSWADSGGITFGVLTGGDGSFALKDVDAGTYRLTANRTGFASASYGARKLSNLGTDLKLTPGQAMKDIVLRLQPQSVVTGRITDTDGEPVANVSVMLMRSVYRNGQRTMAPNGTAMTNDLGEYRIFGVQAGKYKLRAQLPRLNFGEGGDPEEFDPMWYPGQTDPAGAATLEVQPGQTLRGTDMVVRATPTRRVRGTVMVSGAHADIIQVMVSSRDPAGVYLAYRNAIVRPPKLAFQFRLAPGAYNLTAYFNDGAQMMSGIAQLDVGEADVDNVSIQAQPGVELAGRLRIESANDLSALAQNNVQVRLFAKNDGVVMMNPPAGRVGNDGTFTLKNVGPQTMSVAVTGLPTGYYVKAVNYGQQDAKANGLTLTGSNDVVDIIVSPNGANVDGVVHNRAGDPVAGATVVLAPPPGERSDTRRFRTARTDQTGHFNVKGVEPNDYTVFAWEDIEPGEYMDPDVLKAAENHGKALKLKESSQESLDVESIPAEETPAAAGF